jgi:hypothetical protein
MTEHKYDHIEAHEEYKALSWRERRSGGRMLLGFLLVGFGGYWLTNNLTNNVAFIADEPGRVVLPALVILLGIAAIFVKRERRRKNTD